MKKTVLSFILFVMFVGLRAGDVRPNYLMKLASIESDDLLETVYYTYLDNYLLQTSNSTMNDGTKVIDSMYYDEMGNPTMIKFFQLINNEWRWVSYVEFTYDENGNKLSRSNYNDFGSGFVLGGLYQYSYNEVNQLIHWDLYLAGELSQICDFTYNAAGLMIEEIGQASYFGSPMENSWKVDYQYDANNNCISKAQSFWYDTFFDLYSVDQFFYDEHNNCIKWDNLIDNIVVDRHEYTYDLEYSFEQLVFPNNPEAFFPEFVQMKNRLLIDKWYTEDANGQLTYICDYNYNYENLQPQGTPILSVTPESLEFLLVLTQEENGILTVTNTGDANGEFVASITGENADMFAFGNENEAVVAPNSTYELQVNVVENQLESGIYHATIVFETNDPIHANIEIPVTLDIQLGVDELSHTIAIYPNPAVDVLNIKTDDFQLVTLYDVLGHSVYQSEVNAEIHQIDVSKFQTGFYFVKMVSQTGDIEIIKIVIQ